MRGLLAASVTGFTNHMLTVTVIVGYIVKLMSLMPKIVTANVASQIAVIVNMIIGYNIDFTQPIAFDVFPMLLLVK